ncbi:VWA domain-containing protein [candidate division KSB1 bacterium]|nr:VWA domain-containing protein [candidate division KSB1 bacterium]
MKKSLLIPGIIILLFFVFQHSVFAIGALFTRPLNSNLEYNKVWIKSVDAKVEIKGQISVTYVDQTFRNELNQAVEAVWIFPLPEGAVVTELYYWYNGNRYKGEIRERQEAKKKYNENIRKYLDPALLEYLGDNLYRLSIAPIFGASDVRTEITYVELLPYEFGTIDYTFLLNAVGISPKPLNRVSIDGVIETDKPIKFVNSPSHAASTATQITKVNDYRYTIIFGDENFMPDKNLKLEFETIRKEVDVNVIRYTPTDEDSIGTDSYYAVWITPPDSISDDEAIPKKIVFTADVSSSMEGDRILQLKESLMAFLDHLTPDDMFNIITFGTTVQHFRPDLIKVNPDVIQEARTFVTDIGALGLTNIDKAMEESLKQSFSSGYANSIVFITDGYPTWGETFVPTILENIKKNNTNKVRIFPFGVGDDVSKQLLVQMALENGGYAEFIEKDDDIAQIIGLHFTRMSKPVLTDLEIKINGLVTSDKFPRPLQDLFWGNQVLQLGIYKNSGSFPVYLIGHIGEKEVSFMANADFSDVPGGHRFVPRLWAKAKINFLLDQIAIYGELKELVDQVIELSLKFQILTPYTAFYSDPATGINKHEKNDETPGSFTLHQNYPNPFNPVTTICFSLPASGHVVIKIYDITGRRVKTLTGGHLNGGAHKFTWDGTDTNGQLVAAGIYIYRVEFTNMKGEIFTQTKKMSLVK